MTSLFIELIERDRRLFLNPYYTNYSPRRKECNQLAITKPKPGGDESSRRALKYRRVVFK